jgi:serine/threonine protein kinase
VTTDAPDVVGRYALYEEIAAGGMARVHLGRLIGPAGFSRTVAVKRLHSHIARDPDFVTMFLDEARIAARIRHPNVVATLDVVTTGDEVFLVMEYVEGEALSRLEKVAFRRGPIAPPIVVAILAGVLRGLHAAHEARDERGEPLQIVHRDLTPHNILVGTDGLARVLDFGVAKAAGKSHQTRTGELKGKVPYMSPEQIRGSVTRKTDVYAASVVAWEALTGKRLFKGDHDVEVMARVLDANISPPSSVVPSLPSSLDEIVLRGLATDPEARFATAEEMATALEQCMTPATSKEVGAWVESLAGSLLSQRAELVARIESSSPRDKDVDKMTLLGPIRRPTASAASAPAVQVPEVDAPPGSTAAPARSSGGRGLAVAGIALGMAAVLGLGIFLGRRSSGEGTSGNAGADAPLPAAAPSLAASSAVPSATIAVTTSTSAAPTAASTATAATASSSAARAPGRGPAQVAKPPKPSCDPPYTVDAQGVKRYKVECL